jgi:ParB/RepB/Spo0J family partition protein
MGIKQISEGRSDMFLIPYSLIREGDNLRVDYGDIDTLARQLADQGQLKPFEVRMSDSGETAEIIDGHRRYRAMSIAEKLYGADFSKVKCLPERKGANEQTRVLDMLISGDSKPLNALEQAEGFRRLIGYNMTVEEIAKHIGRGVSYVNDILQINSADQSVRDGIKKNRISTTAARKIAKAPVETQREVMESKPETETIRTGDVEQKLRGHSANVSGKRIESSLKTAMIKRSGAEREQYWEGVVFGLRVALGLETV